MQQYHKVEYIDYTDYYYYSIKLCFRKARGMDYDMIPSLRVRMAKHIG